MEDNNYINIDIILKVTYDTNKVVNIGFERQEGYNFKTFVTMEFLEDICKLFDLYGVKAEIINNFK